MASGGLKWETSSIATIMCAHDDDDDDDDDDDEITYFTVR